MKSKKSKTAIRKRHYQTNPKTPQGWVNQFNLNNNMRKECMHTKHSFGFFAYFSLFLFSIQLLIIISFPFVFIWWLIHFKHKNKTTKAKPTNHFNIKNQNIRTQREVKEQNQSTGIFYLPCWVLDDCPIFSPLMKREKSRPFCRVYIRILFHLQLDILVLQIQGKLI